MTATAHALVAGAIAASIQNPAIGLPLAAASHPFLDMIPHWDFGVGWKKKNKFILFSQSFGDLVFGVVLTFAIFAPHTNLVYLAIAIFLSESWDFLMMPYILDKWKFSPFSAFYNVQSEINRNIRLPWGILTQVGTVIGVILILQVFR